MKSPIIHTKHHCQHVGVICTFTMQFFSKFFLPIIASFPPLSIDFIASNSLVSSSSSGILIVLSWNLFSQLKHIPLVYCNINLSWLFLCYHKIPFSSLIPLAENLLHANQVHKHHLPLHRFHFEVSSCPLTTLLLSDSLFIQNRNLLHYHRVLNQ